LRFGGCRKRRAPIGHSRHPGYPEKLNAAHENGATCSVGVALVEKIRLPGRRKPYVRDISAALSCFSG
jgi:hypothetical protein